MECTQRIAKRKQNTRERTTLLLYVKHKDEANEREALYEREYTRYMFECECLYPIGGSLLGNHISTSRAVQNARSVRESEWCKRNTHARESLRKVWRMLTFVFFVREKNKNFNDLREKIEINLNIENENKKTKTCHFLSI